MKNNTSKAIAPGVAKTARMRKMTIMSGPAKFMNEANTPLIS
jgi:hypothetical protein